MASKSSSPSANLKVNNVEVRQGGSAAGIPNSPSNVVPAPSSVSNTLSNAQGKVINTQSPAPVQAPSLNNGQDPAQTLSTALSALLTPKLSPPSSPGATTRTFSGPTAMQVCPVPGGEPALLPLSNVGSQAVVSPKATSSSGSSSSVATPSSSSGLPSDDDIYFSDSDEFLLSNMFRSPTPSPPSSPPPSPTPKAKGKKRPADADLCAPPAKPPTSPVSHASPQRQKAVPPASSPSPSAVSVNNNNGDRHKGKPASPLKPDALAFLQNFNQFDFVLGRPEKKQAIQPNGSACDDPFFRLREDDVGWWVSIARVNKDNTKETLKGYIVNNKTLNIPRLKDLRFNAYEGYLYIEVFTEAQFNSCVQYDWPFGIINHPEDYNPRSPKGLMYRIMFAGETFDFPQAAVRFASACMLQLQVAITSLQTTKNKEVGAATYASTMDWKHHGSCGRIGGTVTVPPEVYDPVTRVFSPLLPLSSTDDWRIGKVHARNIPSGTDDYKFTMVVAHHASTGGFDGNKDVHFACVQCNKITGAPLNYGFVYLDYKAIPFFLANPLSMRNSSIVFSAVKDSFAPK